MDCCLLPGPNFLFCTNTCLKVQFQITSKPHEQLLLEEALLPLPSCTWCCLSAALRQPLCLLHHRGSVVGHIWLVPENWGECGAGGVTGSLPLSCRRLLCQLYLLLQVWHMASQWNPVAEGELQKKMYSVSHLLDRVSLHRGSVRPNLITQINLGRNTATSMDTFKSLQSVNILQKNILQICLIASFCSIREHQVFLMKNIIMFCKEIFPLNLFLEKKL